MNRPWIYSVPRSLSSVENFFDRDLNTFKKSLSLLDAEIDSEALPVWEDRQHRRVLEVFQKSQDACRQFELEIGCDPTVLHDAQDGFRQETDRWFQHSWIANRARTKPSGFAGDFEMLNKLYDKATPARGLGGYLDLCILELPLARAVRTRLAAARKFVVGEIAARAKDTRVLDIACGPCREYLDWPHNRVNRRTEIVAMDNDPKALAYVEANVVNQLPHDTTLAPTRYNALRTRSAKGTIRNFGTFDIIYSVGLCDYLSDEHLVVMLNAWRETLNDGGVMYVAFKDSDRYDKTPYQWHLDWFFFQRTLEDVLRLYDQAGIQRDSVTTTRDASGIIVSFVNRRTQRSTFIRTDQGDRSASQRTGQPARESTTND